MIDLVRLNHIVVVAREGSFVKAATALNLSQPALSRSVQAVERRYDVRIFERGRSGVFLTAVGSRFLAAAEELVARSETGHRELRLISSGLNGPVRFGLGPMSATVMAEPLAKQLMDRGMRAAIRIESDMVLRQLLQAGEIEFYFGGSTDTSGFAAASRFRVTPIHSAGVSLLVRAGHPLLDGVPEGELGDLSGYPVIGGSPLRWQINHDVWASLGLPHPTLEMDNYDCLIRICQSSDAILLASRTFLRSVAPGMCELPCPVPLVARTLTARLVRLSDRGLSRAAQELADLVARLYRELA